MHLCIQSELSGLWLPTCHLCTHSGRIQWLPWGPEVGIRFRFPILGHFSHQGDSYLGASLIQSFDEKKRRPMMPPSKFWMAVYPSMLKNSNKPWAVGPADSPWMLPWTNLPRNGNSSSVRSCRWACRPGAEEMVQRKQRKNRPSKPQNSENSQISSGESQILDKNGYPLVN